MNMEGNKEHKWIHYEPQACKIDVLAHQDSTKDSFHIIHIDMTGCRSGFTHVASTTLVTIYEHGSIDQNGCSTNSEHKVYDFWIGGFVTRCNCVTL